MYLPPVSAERWTSMRERKRTAIVAGGCLLRDEPFRKLPGSDPGLGRGRILLVGGRSVQLDGRNVEQHAELVGQARLDDLVADAGPVFEAGDEDGVVRQVQHGAGAEGGDDLALAKLAGRLFASLAGSLSRPPRFNLDAVHVFSQRLTLGSTSRSERFARNLRCRAGSVLQLGVEELVQERLRPTGLVLVVLKGRVHLAVVHRDLAPVVQQVLRSVADALPDLFSFRRRRRDSRRRHAASRLSMTKSELGAVP